MSRCDCQALRSAVFLTYATTLRWGHGLYDLCSVPKALDVVPQAKRLRLALNMRFSELNDPKGLCKDVTNIGRWGNGDVEVMLSSLDELPYVMGLVRQSLELQLGNGAGP
jgi:hypothetical protein